jgi:hypothetical protein
MNVFSFCLYGPENPRYYPGMLENVYLAGKYFPTWKVYVYYAPDVTESMINHLAACSNVVLRATGILGAKNMIHRFFAIDEPDVDLMMVRDADSRIHWKDRWAIREFVSSPCIAHTIRDQEMHTALMMGGLWGLKKSAGIHMQTQYANYAEDTSLGHRFAHDQNFLIDVIYPKVLPNLLVHYSHGLRADNERHATRFPFEWSNDVYCGRIESSYVDMPQPPPKRTLFFPSPPVRVSPPPPPPPPPPPAPYVSIQPSVHILKFLNKK